MTNRTHRQLEAQDSRAPQCPQPANPRRGEYSTGHEAQGLPRTVLRRKTLKKYAKKHDLTADLRKDGRYKLSDGDFSVKYGRNPNGEDWYLGLKPKK